VTIPAVRPPDSDPIWLTPMWRAARAAATAAPPLTQQQRDTLRAAIHGHRIEAPTGQPEVNPTSLYRYFDTAGTLLYLGITNNDNQRDAWHCRHQIWWRFQVERRPGETFAKRTDAVTAERDAIRAEGPIFNVTHAEDGRHERIVNYLIEHEAFDLLGIRGLVNRPGIDSTIRELHQLGAYDSITVREDGR